MTNRAKAVEHARQAEEDLADSKGGKKFGQPLWAAQAAAHATLALYYQREADREQH